MATAIRLRRVRRSLTSPPPPSDLRSEPSKQVLSLSPVCRVFSGNGAAQESNLPSRGLHDLTGFEGWLDEVQLSTEAGFWPRFRPLRCAGVRSDRYQFRYQVLAAGSGVARSGDTVEFQYRLCGFSARRFSRLQVFFRRVRQ
jgi:hypothetical protein